VAKCRISLHYRRTNSNLYPAFNSEIKLHFILQLPLKADGFKFAVSSSAFTTVRYIEAGKMRGIEDPYIAPMPEVKLSTANNFVREPTRMSSVLVGETLICVTSLLMCVPREKTNLRSFVLCATTV
jgi:hypothetical protein